MVGTGTYDSCDNICTRTIIKNVCLVQISFCPSFKFAKMPQPCNICNKPIKLLRNSRPFPLLNHYEDCDPPALAPRAHKSCIKNSQNEVCVLAVANPKTHHTIATAFQTQCEKMEWPLHVLCIEMLMST